MVRFVKSHPCKASGLVPLFIFYGIVSLFLGDSRWWIAQRGQKPSATMATAYFGHAGCHSAINKQTTKKKATRDLHPRCSQAGKSLFAFQPQGGAKSYGAIPVSLMKSNLNHYCV